MPRPQGGKCTYPERECDVCSTERAYLDTEYHYVERQEEIQTGQYNANSVKPSRLKESMVIFFTSPEYLTF